MAVTLQTAHTQLWKWCRAQGLAGYDPYDGLNSRLFQALTLKKSRAARLTWIQFHKRSPINFRSLVGIPRERNAKAIALFALAALADFRRNPTKENEIEARELLDDLMCLVGVDEEADVALTPAQAADLERRMREADEGKEELIPGDKAFEMLRNRTI